eukprot:TRINITY_DN2454_c0_g1::TRINITY_DN2454_c0_g1_i1::g.8864::m.8864 TRINITY_DN2454_c0_g1::TRINITY_DN2454_c0_g1_i1::g.8864  ORF type:complete len:329 (-),score=23.96,sp/Q9VCA8/ANKHM_DROME/25.99/2e-08,Ank_2/PF12796.2/5.3e-07,Ank_2/PF12796.2/1.4e-06,Ank_2/PF12796.2/7.3e-10,Ank/PF00023.25/0.16,Ank/PF00023.25/0.0005,Ank/PF00023.25/4.9e+02,Ank/PF00023.25/2.1e+03,Ank/PF00023.25/19,Ank/PF00023.25/1.7e-05,Ank_3/PF13606.1/4.4,Ank_3/PF13606.1/0.005,Ank_3/PF13606.1/1.8e+02,Ank_3/PF13606.1/9.1e+03,Ank_3/PF13606.1/
MIGQILLDGLPARMRRRDYIFQQAKSGGSALHFACLGGHLSSAEFLVKSLSASHRTAYIRLPAEIKDGPMNDKHTALMHACSGNHADIVSFLLASLPVRMRKEYLFQQDERERTALMNARDPAIVKLLLDSIPTVKARVEYIFHKEYHKSSMNALMWMSMSRTVDVSTLKSLLDYLPNTQTRVKYILENDFNRNTAVKYACKSANYPAVKFLLDSLPPGKRWSCILAQDAYGKTPLMEACKSGSLDIVILLLSYLAALSVDFSEPSTVLDYVLTVDNDRKRDLFDFALHESSLFFHDIFIPDGPYVRNQALHNHPWHHPPPSIPCTLR